MPTAIWSNEPTTTVFTTLTARVTFDEPISGFVAGDLLLRRTNDNRNYVPTRSQTTLTDLGSNVWEVQIFDLESLIGQQNTDFLLRLRPRSVFFETSQINGPNGARNSANFTIDTTPQAVPVEISAFANQNITIDTDMALDINITGNPDKAWIEGNLEGFHSFWEDPTLKVRGTGTRLIKNEPLTVHAKKGSDEPVTRRGSFSVLPAAPVISTVPRQNFVKGTTQELIVPISNNPALVRAKSKWFGMKYEPHAEGIRIFGDIPAAGDLSFEDGVIQVLAQTGELIDEAEIEFEITDAVVVYIADDGTNDIFCYAIPIQNGGTAIKRKQFSLAGANTRVGGIAVTNDYIYTTDGTGQRVYRINKDIEDGGNPTATTSYSTGSWYPAGIAIDGSSAYQAQGSSSSRRLLKSTLTDFATGTNDLVSISGSGRITVDDTYIWLADNTAIRRYTKSSFPDGTLSLFNSPSLDTGHLLRGIDVNDDYIFCVVDKGSTAEVLILNKSDATEVATVSLPDTISQPNGIALEV